MSSFAVYQLNSEQTDLFYFNKDGNLDLDAVLEKMVEEFETPYEGTKIIGNGFLNPEIVTKNVKLTEVCNVNNFKFNTETDEFKVIQTTITGSGSLGYYNEAHFENGHVVSQKKQHTLFSNANILLTESGLLIAYFENVAAEKIKSQIRTLFEDLGFDITTFRFSTELLKNVREHFDWTEVKLERIDNDEDSTKKVSYEIDITDKDSDSKIDQIYKDKGFVVQISIQLPYTLSNNTSQNRGSFGVKLYHKDHRGSLMNSEFDDDHEEMKNFIIYLTNYLVELSKEA